ncbi:3634_t:CDS:2, partial [Entrophospora sp. SA101]
CTSNFPKGGSFNICSLESDFTSFTIEIPEQTKLVFNDINKIEEGKYCQLIQKNFTSIDVIVAPDALLQMTVGKSHPINVTGIRKNLVKKMDLYDNYLMNTFILRIGNRLKVPGDKFTVW